MSHMPPCPLVGKPGAHDYDPHTIGGCECPHDDLCPSAYTFGVCECALIETVRNDERTIRWDEKRTSYLEGAEKAYKDALELASDLAHEQGGCFAVHICEFEGGVAELVRKLEDERNDLDNCSANEDDAACCVYEQGYSLRDQVSEKYADSCLRDYKERTFPSDWAGHVSAHTDDPILSKLFWACSTEWAPGFTDFDDEARSARDIKITPIGRALLDMVEQGLKDGGVLPSTPPAPDSNEREQNQKYEVEISDASDTHVPWCSDLDCFGCECLHENVTEVVCDDCGENYDDDSLRASIGISAPLLEASLSESELVALREAARAAERDGRYILRTCWVCNPAHEHLRASDCVLECFGCGEFYYRGARITEGEANDA